MAVKNYILPIPLTSIDSTIVDGSYTAINDGGLPHACCIIRITNDSTEAVTISFDGTTDHEFLLSDTDLLIQAQTNSQPNNFICNFRVGTIIYVKGTSGTGNIYLSGYYQPEGVL